MHDTPDQFLEVEDLTKTYRGGWGLHDVSFSMGRGRIAALDGPNGSGKSTLLRCLAGLVQHRGRITLRGESLHERPELRAEIGFLPQSIAFPEQATIGEVMDLFARLRGTTIDDHPFPDGFVSEEDRLMGELSGGQRHRVAVAVAFLGRPSLLLLDEPVAGLDVEARATFWTVLRGLADRDGVTSIVSSPFPAELRSVADCALHMSDGDLRSLEDPIQSIRLRSIQGTDERLEDNA
jgi:ABC-type multidrug transport system ATPase subunit